MKEHEPTLENWAQHEEVMARLQLTDADPGLQKCFALVWQSGAGHPMLKWLLNELEQPTWTMGSSLEHAIAQCARQEVAALIRDMVGRGQSALEHETQQHEK